LRRNSWTIARLLEFTILTAVPSGEATGAQRSVGTTIRDDAKRMRRCEHKVPCPRRHSQSPRRLRISARKRVFQDISHDTVSYVLACMKADAIVPG
jgi:hypothetical protein